MRQKILLKLFCFWSCYLRDSSLHYESGVSSSEGRVNKICVPKSRFNHLPTQNQPTPPRSYCVIMHNQPVHHCPLLTHNVSSKLSQSVRTNVIFIFPQGQKSQLKLGKFYIKPLWTNIIFTDNRIWFILVYTFDYCTVLTITKHVYHFVKFCQNLHATFQDGAQLMHMCSAHCDEGKTGSWT